MCSGNSIRAECGVNVLITKPGDTCKSIIAKQKITQELLITLNPGNRDSCQPAAEGRVAFVAPSDI